MGKIPDELREIIAWNIRDCRYKRFPGNGGSKQCAEVFNVPPQQWSHWETGKRTPDEISLARIARFFNKTVEYMRRDNQRSAQAGDEDAGHQAIPGSPESFYWLLRDFLDFLKIECVRRQNDRSPPDTHDHSDHDSK